MNEKWNNVSHIILVGSIIYSEDNNSIQIIELDHELPVAKFRHKLRKVDKTARPFRHDLNQIPYDYAMEVTNRFKGLELIDSTWRTTDRVHDFVQEAVIKTIPKKKKCKKSKWLSEEALQIAVKRREIKGKGEKESYTHLNAEFQRTAGEIRKPSSGISAKKQRKTIEWERPEISSRKSEIPREYFMQRWAQ